MTPDFITFTGADDKTDPADMVRLAESYPVEFGILMSPTREGTPRYPSQDWIDTIRGQGLRLSAHLCGGYSRALIARLERGGGRDELDLEGFLRLQLNTTQTVAVELFREWARPRRVRPILQCRGAFPSAPGVAWLFDRSGGRGTIPAAWPTPARPGVLVGYAGGLGPETITEALPHFRAPYWIDMETRVRNERDEFDLAVCHDVCLRAFGLPQIARTGGGHERRT